MKTPSVTRRDFLADAARLTAGAAALTAIPAEAARDYDLVITGGRVMDPATGTDRIGDVGVRNGRVVTTHERGLRGRETLDARGKVVAVTDQARKGEIGKSILRGAVKSGENTWTGELTDAGTGKVYSGTVTLESASALSLQGCIARILCQSETWTKVK